MKNVQKWEIAGVPAAIAFAALHALGAFEAVGLSAEDLPHVMVLAFIAMAGVRAAIDRAKAAAE